MSEDNMYNTEVIYLVDTGYHESKDRTCSHSSIGVSVMCKKKCSTVGWTVGSSFSTAPLTFRFSVGIASRWNN